MPPRAASRAEEARVDGPARGIDAASRDRRRAGGLGVTIAGTKVREDMPRAFAAARHRASMRVRSATIAVSGRPKADIVLVLRSLARESTSSWRAMRPRCASSRHVAANRWDPIRSIPIGVEHWRCLCEPESKKSFHMVNQSLDPAFARDIRRARSHPSQHR
jgi:hypothetical protein